MSAKKSRRYEVQLRPTQCTTAQVIVMAAKFVQVNADGTLVFYDSTTNYQPQVKAAFRAHCWMTVQELPEPT
jgi:hypothetical protein